MSNSKSVFTTIGARTYALNEREENDFYATEPKAVELLLEEELFSRCVLEPACGQGHIAEVLKKSGYKVLASDLVDRGYGDTIDFFDMKQCYCDIITNPPYKLAQKFVEHALDIAEDGIKVAMLLKLTFLEGKARKKLFEKYPFKTLYVSSSRLNCAKNGDFEKYGNKAVAYAWYVWQKGYKGRPSIKWIN